MSLLGDAIDRKMGGRPVKELFTVYLEALGSKEPLSTFETKLSKLRNGSPEGERHFLQNPDRARALEMALGVDPGWLAAQRQVRVLVLDPGLSEKATAFLKDREGHAAGAFACHEVSLEGLSAPIERSAVLARTREAAERESTALVVTMDRKDALYFEGAKLCWTPLKWHALGFVLESDPELVPLPEPGPPPLFGDHDEPLMPHPDFEVLVQRELTTRHAWEDDPRGSGQGTPTCQAPDCLFQRRSGRDRAASDLRELATALHRATHAGHVASFPVRLVVAWQLRGQGLDLHIIDHGDRSYGTSLSWVTRSGGDRELAEAVHRAMESPGSTILWSHARRVLGVGPLVDPITRLLGPYHEVATPPALLRWREAIQGWSPWRSGADRDMSESEQWRTLRTDVLGELGVPIEAPLVGWRQRVGEKCVWSQAPARLATPDEERSAQEALSALAARTWHFDGWSRAWPLRLDAASRASLAILPGHGEREGLHVVASLGAGRLLRIQVARFPGEKQAKIVKCGGDLEMDGGDVHLWFQELSDAYLVGTMLGAHPCGQHEDDA